MPKTTNFIQLLMTSQFGVGEVSYLEVKNLSWKCSWSLEVIFFSFDDWESAILRGGAPGSDMGDIKGS